MLASEMTNHSATYAAVATTAALANLGGARADVRVHRDVRFRRYHRFPNHPPINMRPG
jgi:hypothetical protein